MNESRTINEKWVANLRQLWLSFSTCRDVSVMRNMQNHVLFAFSHESRQIKKLNTVYDDTRRPWGTRQGVAVMQFFSQKTRQILLK